MTTYSEAVEQTITAGEQIHQIVNGTTTTEVIVEDGSKIPSVRKALLDNFYYKDPINWQQGQSELVFNQIRKFTDGTWWVAPTSTATNPVVMGVTPYGDPLWKVFSWDRVIDSQKANRNLIERSWTEVGNNVVKGSFQEGATLNTTTDVIINYGTDFGVYSWGGTLPKVVPANSAVTGTGGITPTTWINTNNKHLRSDLTSTSGDSLIGIGNGRTQQDKNHDLISVLDEGAKGNSSNGTNGDDDTAAWIAARDKCLVTGKSLIIPKTSGGYRLTATVDLRGINIIAGGELIYINHTGIGLIIGGNASNANNPEQKLGTTIRISGVASTDTPDIRAIGVKGQYIHIQSCEYLQVYADNSPEVSTTDYSSAYSSYYLKRVYTIELKSAPSTQGWINENNFYLNRTNKIIFSDGDYSHNHNKFYSACMESQGLIDLPIGNNNKFYGFRFERVPSQPSETLTINFGVETWDNSVQASWVSSPRYTNEPYNPNNLVTVTDDGQGNSVYNIQDIESDERVIFDLSPSTPFLSSINAGLVGTLNQNTDIGGVRYVKSLARGKFRCTTSNAGLYSDGRIFEFRNGDKIAFISDQIMFRPLIYLYDANGNVLVNEPTDNILSLAGKIWANGAYTLGANIKSFSALFKKTSQAKYFRVALNFGNSTSGIDFEYARLTMRMPKNSTGAPRKGFDVNTPSRVYTLPYFNSSDVNMANIGQGITCFKTDMTELKINLLRHRYYVSNIAGNILTVAGGSVQYFDLSSCFVVYTDATGANLQLSVSAVSGNTITLSAAAPADITVGASIDFIVTKTKTLS